MFSLVEQRVKVMPFLYNHAEDCLHGSVRTPLLGGASETEGIVEVCINGTYFPVTLDNGMFSVREASAICKQLDFGNGKHNSDLSLHIILSA